MSRTPALGTIVSVRTGRVAPLGETGRHSAIAKHAAAGPVRITARGLEGDEQADLAHHGGPDKAVYGYPLAHYAAWRESHPQHAARLTPGGFGENLTIAGADESTICLGDVLGAGTATLGACQPRQPCNTLAAWFADRTLPRAMTQTGRSGWYFRVLAPGAVREGDAITLLERPNPAWPFARFLRALRAKAFTTAELEELATLPGLAAQWQRDAARTRERRSG